MLVFGSKKRFEQRLKKVVHEMPVGLVIFANTQAVAVRILLPKLLKVLEHRTDLKCVAIFPTKQTHVFGDYLRFWQSRFVRSLQILMGGGKRERSLAVKPLNLYRLARQHGAILKVPPNGNPNHPDFLTYLKQNVQADFAINLYSLSIFKDELLNRFAMVVNYHNGSLPRFRGLRATNWSLYLTLPTSGYAFHRMDIGVDTGNILATGQIATELLATAADHEQMKAVSASGILSSVLDSMLLLDDGTKQTSEPFIECLLNANALHVATHLDNPSSLSCDEWAARLRAFLLIFTCINGKILPITSVAEGNGTSGLCFRSADGRWLRVTGIGFWPTWVYFLLHLKQGQ